MDELKPYSNSFNVFVGIPDSPLYKYVLNNNLYEHVDDVGLVYLPGYDTKTKFFYGLDSKFLVDYKFEQRTDFDKKLLRNLYIKKLKKMINPYFLFARGRNVLKKGIKKIA